MILGVDGFVQAVENTIAHYIIGIGEMALFIVLIVDGKISIISMSILTLQLQLLILIRFGLQVDLQIGDGFG